MKKFAQSALTAISGAAVTLFPSVVSAQAFPELNPVGNADILQIFDRIINFILGIAGAIAVIYLIWAGIQYITGGAKGAQAAKDAIVNAIIGVVVILLSYVIINAVITAIGG